jgi:hypothetical protein
MRAIIYELELKDDRTVTITLPQDIILGKHQVVLVIDENVKDAVSPAETYDELLRQTCDLWKQSDGLGYQGKIRDEWNRRSGTLDRFQIPLRDRKARSKKH